MDYEEKETFKLKLNGRNTDSAFQAIRDMDIFMRETRETVELLTRTIGEMHLRLAVVETSINMIKVVTTGLGPTMKND